jgi:hypothetical protein
MEALRHVADPQARFAPHGSRCGLDRADDGAQEARLARSVGPTIVTISPGSIARLTLRRTWAP